MKKIYKTITALLLVCIMVIPGSLSANAAAIAFATDYATLKTAIDNKADTIIIMNDISLADVISITYDVTIASNGATIYPASGKFHFNVLNSSDITVTFQGVILDGNQICGGILTYANAIIDGAVIKNCVSSGNGAIYGRGRLTLNNCEFINNRSTSYGGAVVATAPLTVNNCVFTNNNAGAGGGGAIYAEYTTSITSCTFTGNVAYKGGAIYFGWENSSSSSFSYQLTLLNVDFLSNSAGYGGAIYAQGFIYANHINFTYNSAGYTGGAIYFIANGSIGGKYIYYTNNTPNMFN